MNKVISTIMLIAAAAVSTVYSQTINHDNRRANAERVRRLAGRLPRIGSMKGTISFIDTQDIMAEADIRKAMNGLKDAYEFNVTYEKANASKDYFALKEHSGATVAVIIINDTNAPQTLISPDQHWAVMNVAGLDKNLTTESAKNKFLAQRQRKQLMRVYAMLCGGWYSGYLGNISSTTSVSDLDLVQEKLPADVQDRNLRFFKAVGITPLLYVPYHKAVMEGWAPAPTNDVQKAIWDKVHAMPTEPLKIKPETKKVEK